MPFGTITSTENTFGSITGAVTGAIPGTLSGSIGVPGPQGPTGPQGPAGAAGQGVPAGGTAGQFLTKIDGTNYNTDWTTINLSAYAVKANNLSDLTNASTARNNLSLGPTNTVAFRTVNLSEGAVAAGDTLSTLSIATSAGGYALSANTESFIDQAGDTIVSESGTLDLNKGGFHLFRYPSYNTNNPADPTSGGEINYVASTGVLTIRAFDDGAATDDTITVEPTGVTFADSTKQVTAFLPADYYTASYIDTTFAPLASPALTGNPTAPTATFGDNDTSIATTAFVQAGLLGGTANARNLEVQVRNQSGSTIAAGSIVYISGATGNLPLITLAQANNDANSAQTIGFVKTSIANNGTGYVIVRGVLEAIDTSALTEGVQLYLSPTTAGTWTTTKPSAPEHLVYVGVVIRSHPTLGTILVAVQNGYELHELHDVALSSEANNDLLVYELSTDLWKNKSFATLGLAGLNSPTFTGTPSLPTGTTGVTQTAGNNTTALATTAFVQQEVPAASTTAAGKVELATDAEVIAGTSTTLALVANNYRLAGLTTNIWAPGYVNLAAGTSGTGSATGASSFTLSGTLTAPNASTAGYATRGFLLHYPSNGGTTSYNFSTASGHAMRFYSSSLGSTIAGVKARAVFGRTNVLISAASTLAVRGYGWEWDFSTRTMNIIAHNGTTLTTTAVTWNPSGSRTYEVVATSDGAGTISLYVDGTLLGTSTGGPTGLINVGSNFLWWQAEVQNEATAGSQVSVQLTNPKVYTTNG